MRHIERATFCIFITLADIAVFFTRFTQMQIASYDKFN